jgi:hypothetical protein
VTGIGFIGAGFVFGYGHLFLGLIMAAIFMFILELQHIPGLRDLDASHIADRFANDFDVPTPALIEPKTPAAPAADGSAGEGTGPPPT